MQIKKIISSLRFKLIISSLFIQIVFVSILVINSVHLVEKSLLSQAKLRATELERLLNSSISGLLVEQDLEAVQDIFKENTGKYGVNYLVLLNSDGHVLASSNWSVKGSVPEKISNIENVVASGGEVYQGGFSIFIGDIKYGEIRYGISTEFFIASRAALVSASGVIAAIGLFFSAIALFLISRWLTKNLDKLSEASDSFANGDLRVRVNIKSNDEISRLALAFNNMAEALDKRINELRHSRQIQDALLDASNAEKARLSSLLKVMTTGIVFVTKESSIMYCNPAFVKMWAFDEDQDLHDFPVSELISCLEDKIEKKDNSNLLFKKIVDSDSNDTEFELCSGKIVLQRCYPVYDDSRNRQGTLWVFEDVTKERQTANQLMYLAERDFLTGLRNRRRFHEELTRQLDTCARHNKYLGLLFFDIDDFKYINDACGHKCGDDLLIRIAGDVGKLVRKDEMFCRLGGDEFAILLPDSNIDAVSNLAIRIVNAISKISLIVKGRDISVTSSIGIAVYPIHARDSEELLACADVAMYQAKESGKNAWKVYEEASDNSQHLLKRIDWDDRIKSAIKDGNFELSFQGVYDLVSGELEFFEVLVRMMHSNSDQIEYFPGQFIHFAESSGSIRSIDRYVINKAIKHLAQDQSVPCLSVNVSGRSIDDISLSRYIFHLLDTYKVVPSRLMIELTETAVVSDLQDAQRFIESMHQYGCKIAIDDFGAGYASFVYLKHLDADVIKIDGLFIHDLINDRQNQVFVKAIVDMAKGLGRRTVAEFVEDEATLQLITSLGVDMAQGYYLQEPAICFVPR